MGKAQQSVLDETSLSDAARPFLGPRLVGSGFRIQGFRVQGLGLAF